MGLRNNLINSVKRVVYNADIKGEKWLSKKASKFEVNGIYDNRTYKNNIANSINSTAVSSRKKELAIEQILDNDKFTFNHMLLVQNPFRISVLSGMLIFVTQKPYKVEYTVKGKRGSADFTKCDETVTTRHRVPILGLYEDCINQIVVRLVGDDGVVAKKKTIRLKTPKLSMPIDGCVEVTDSKAPLSKDFILASGGYHGGVYVFDAKGNIRLALARIPQYYGIYLFDDGRFLFPEMNMRRPEYGNAHTIITHEMDMLGRVYHTYYHEKGFHHWAIEKEPGGNILTLTSSVDDTYMENCIVEIDRKTGEVVREISVNDLFDDKIILNVICQDVLDY